MLCVVVRHDRPDAPYWAGRRWLAAIDAVVWPLAWILAIRAIPAPTGLVGPAITAICVRAALSRLHTAICENHRYWFTTWKWGRIAFAVWLVGLVMKVSLTA